MRKIIDEYGGAIIAILATVLLLVMLPSFAARINSTTADVIEKQKDFDDISGGKNVYPLSIDGEVYEYEEGMTWNEWINSSYNTGGFISYINPCTLEEMLGKCEITTIVGETEESQPLIENETE